MTMSEPRTRRLFAWKIGVVALVLGALQAALSLLFPSAGEVSAVLLGCLMLCVFGVAGAGFVAALHRIANVASVDEQRRARGAAIMNAAAALLPPLAWLVYLLMHPSGPA